MATDLDTFVLLYKAETADAQKKLDQLNEKLDKVGKKNKEAQKETKLMGDKFGEAAMASLASGAAIASAMAMVVKGLKAATDAARDYNEQMLIARRTGIGTLAQENIALNLARASGGYIGRGEARSAVNTIGDTLNAAYTDPTRMNAQNIRLRMMGVSVTGSDGQINSAQNVMNQLSKRWAKMTDEMAQAEGQLLGLTPQATEALRQLNGAVDDSSNMTLVAAQRQADAAEAAKKLSSATNGITTDLSTMAKVLIDEAMPAVSKFFEKIQGGTHELADALNKEGTSGFISHAGSYLGQAAKNLFSGKGLPIGLDAQKKLWGETSTHTDSAEEANEMKRLINKQNDAAQVQHAAAEKMQLTANQFAAAVAAMPGSLSEQEAIAAWAGDAAKGMTVGGAGGTPSNGSNPVGSGPSNPSATPGTGATRGIRNNNPGNLEYGKFAKSMGATGSDGRFAIFPTMEAGVAAHTALLSGGGYLGAGLDTPAKIIAKYAPASENNQSAYLKAVGAAGFAPNQKLSASDMGRFAAAMEVHESGYRGGSGGAPGGLSFNQAQQLIAARGIAGQLGVNPEQLMRGGLNKGDVQYGVDKQRFGIGQSMMKIQNEIAAADSINKPLLAAKHAHELVSMRNQLQALDQYGSGLVDRQKADGNPRTQGMPPIPININIHSNQSPDQIAVEVKKVLSEEMGKAVNDSNSKTVS